MVHKYLCEIKNTMCLKVGGVFFVVLGYFFFYHEEKGIKRGNV